MEIFFVRHGATHWNSSGKWQGSTDIELSQNGRNQAFEAARLLSNENFSVIYSSPKARTMETAKFIAELTSKEIIQDQRIVERNMGIFEGKTSDQISSIMGKEMSVVDIVSCEEPVDGMEPLDAQFKRGREFLQDLKEKGEDAVVVSHGVMIGIMLEILTGKDFRYMTVKNCEIIREKVF
ncbi:MAG: histidine phosphatase family protein [Candidatus Thermoplasmatota archaeon]|jgi:broad specificity phosphatase PhoE|nr:histidine phosphatase family protein [Candidatus Thermoplasmatota archaeon]